METKRKKRQQKGKRRNNNNKSLGNLEQEEEADGRSGNRQHPE